MSENNLLDLYINAARRYCNENYSKWMQEYMELEKRKGDSFVKEYTSEEYGIFPRYNILNAILKEIESIHPEDVQDKAELIELLLLAGVTTDDQFTQKPKNKVAERAISEERDKFCSYIKLLTDDKVSQIDLLPFRRKLKQSDKIKIWEKIRTKFQIKDWYFYPLDEKPNFSVLSLRGSKFEDLKNIERFREIFKLRGVETVYEFLESGDAYLVGVDDFDPGYFFGEEGFWVSAKLDWLIYASHEDSISFTGDWLIDSLKKLIPKIEGILYDDCFAKIRN